MTISRRVISRWLPVLSLALSAGLCSHGLAQVLRLPQDLVTAEAVTPAQQDQIDTFVKAHARNVLEANQALSASRDALIEPARLPLATPVFKDAYARSVIANIRPGIENTNPVVRLNSYIVLAEMPSAAVADLAARGMADANIGVRYWAAKAAADVGPKAGAGENIFSSAQQQGLLRALSAAMAKETSDAVLEQMYRALGSLTIPQAQEALLKTLDSRVRLHAAGINEGLRADVAGLSKFKTALVFADAQGKSVDQPVRDLTAIAAKYLTVAARQLNSGNLRPELIPLAHAAVTTAEEIFVDLALKRFDPSYAKRPQLSVLLGTSNYKMLELNVYEWVGTKDRPGVLQDSKVAVPFDRVSIDAAAPAASATTAAPAAAPAAAPKQ